MNSEANKRVVREMYGALNAGDSAGYFARMSDAVELTFFGSHRLSRTFYGKAEIMRDMVPVLRQRLEGTIEMHVKNMVAEADQVVVEVQGKARTKDGRSYDNQYCIVLALRDGLVVSMREYMDTQLTYAIFG